MPKFSFVILHYNSIDDTYACVSSICENCAKDDYRIYIVDNASPNGSGSQLQKDYAESADIRIILNERNLGFAKGNNLGIAASIKDGYSDFVIVLNSDTKIIQQDFCKRIETEYTASSFAVLGPTIYTPQGKTRINPGRSHILKGSELNSVTNFYRRNLYFVEHKNRFGLKLNQKVMAAIQRFKDMFKHSFEHAENCVLHGCCLVLSKKFFEKFKGFDDRTFLYFEEEILYAHVVKSGLKTVYAPDIKIWHKEDGATDSVIQSSEEKNRFVFSNILKSIDVYKLVLDEYRERM